MEPTESQKDTTIHLDAAGVKALAHPLRSRLVSALRTGGPDTATGLARRLGTNSGATSYHLRRLAEVGLVVETDEGTARERVWKAATRGHSWRRSELDADEDARVAMDWLESHYLRLLVERQEAYRDHELDWPVRWRDVLGYGDDSLVVTAEQLRRFSDEFEALLARYRHAGQADPEATRIVFHYVAAPYDPAAPPPDAGGSPEPADESD
ncbi:helix-turn-helix domain-containing protein [Brooklawnia cerclae]|uniref:DNA-binding transcriptional ArsR family regulator n=1 Tax=Brooklawnia cerclae TaxID=349934 RepID=A0ABX0SEP9_9ACTN|nr:helix-turn-helix domain-containing protein [Brooklawnia cerclae]NIH56500.1 DNA-binding transcriptional ArsR family regulator [Brooklawnia cerclae]